MQFTRLLSRVIRLTFAVVIAITVPGLATMTDAAELITVEAAIPSDFPDDAFTHDSFERLLQAYVDDDGNVDYEKWQASDSDIATIDSYLAAVIAFSPDNSPERFPSRNDKLAYWMYAYNAYVIKAVLLRWPLDSVTDVKAPLEIVKGYGFFYRQRFLFGGKKYNLYNVEKKKIRAQFKDPRIHFVLNCASESCPILRPELPTGDELEPFLQESAVHFVSEPRNVRIDHTNRRIVLSDIFKLYKSDFIKELRRRGLSSKRGVVDYILTLAQEPLLAELQESSSYKVVFDDYDWSINQAPAVN